MLIILMIIPVLAYRFMLKNATILNYFTLRSKFGVLYFPLKIYKFDALFWTMFFCVRRIIFTVSIFVFSVAPLIQACLNIGISLPYLWYIIEVKPFDATDFFYYEILNESILLLISLFSLPYINIIRSGKTKTELGWLIVALTFLNTILNLLNVLCPIILFPAFHFLKQLVWPHLEKLWFKLKRLICDMCKREPKAALKYEEP